MEVAGKSALFSGGKGGKEPVRIPGLKSGPENSVYRSGFTHSMTEGMLIKNNSAKID